VNLLNLESMGSKSIEIYFYSFRRSIPGGSHPGFYTFVEAIRR